MSVLDEIVETKRREVERLVPRRAELRAAAESAPEARAFTGALERDGEVSLIAEVKRRSPSAGWIRPDLSVEAVARAYAAADAAAVSVLTDADYFGGSLETLKRVGEAASLPVLRKDFVLDAVQLWEARAAGADAALLIVRILDDAELRDLIQLGTELGLGLLVEVHDAAELGRALAAGAEVVGINNRDLGTFRTDLSVALELAPEVAEERVVVAESGIRTAEDVDRLGAAGVSAVLVGESLMRAEEPGRAAAELVGRPRAQRVAARPGKR